MSELIRPVAATIEPELTRVTRIYGLESRFPIPTELGVIITLAPGHLPSQANLDIEEVAYRVAGATMLDINVFPYMGNQDLVRAWGSFRETGSIKGKGIRQKSVVLAEEALSQQYLAEAAMRLMVVEGTDLRFVIGEKANGDEVFVDGWAKEAQSPAWRVHLPVQDRKLTLADSRLLIFG